MALHRCDDGIQQVELHLLHEEDGKRLVWSNHRPGHAQGRISWPLVDTPALSTFLRTHVTRDAQMHQREFEQLRLTPLLGPSSSRFTYICERDHQEWGPGVTLAEPYWLALADAIEDVYASQQLITPPPDDHRTLTEALLSRRQFG